MLKRYDQESYDIEDGIRALPCLEFVVRCHDLPDIFQRVASIFVEMAYTILVVLPVLGHPSWGRNTRGGGLKKVLEAGEASISNFEVSGRAGPRVVLAVNVGGRKERTEERGQRKGDRKASEIYVEQHSS